MAMIVAIGWMYVVLMMSITENSVVAGIVTFFLYGVFPLAIILYLMYSPQRRARRAEEEKIVRERLRANAAEVEGEGPDTAEKS